MMLFEQIIDFRIKINDFRDALGVAWGSFVGEGRLGECSTVVWARSGIVWGVVRRGRKLRLGWISAVVSSNLGKVFIFE